MQHLLAMFAAAAVWRQPYAYLAETFDVGVEEISAGKLGIVGWGWSSLPGGFGGTIDPSSIDGHTMRQIQDTDESGIFLFRLESGSPPTESTYLDKLVIEDSGGTVELLQSDATFLTDSSTYSRWEWTSTYWTGDWENDIGNQRDVEVWLT